MYRSTPTQVFAAGHASAGVTAPATNWFLAEGAATPAQIVVERAMYTSPDGVVWAGGTDALATRLRW